MTFVRTAPGEWTNLDRASGITAQRSDRTPGTWVVVAHFSGRHPVIRSGFPSFAAADAWVEDLLDEFEELS